MAESAALERPGATGTPVRTLEFVTLPKALRGGREQSWSCWGMMSGWGFGERGAGERMLGRLE